VSPVLSPADVARCAQTACLLEVAAPKPGNVSRRHDFDDASFEDFLLSAVAVGPALGAAGQAGVGPTVLRAVQETRRRVATNTNLGIVLLLAPLARALLQEGGALRRRLAEVLRALSVDDARDVYAAVRLAEPGGLGQVDAHDVRGEADVSLRVAMAAAAERDTIAREYVTDYDVTFGLAVPALRRSRGSGLGWSEATQDCYLQVLAAVPDTLVARKRGVARARDVSARAAQVLAAGAPGSSGRRRAANRLHDELAGAGERINPGTTADLVAAALFVVVADPEGEQP